MTHMLRPTGVVVPLRSFTLGNTRLAGVLDEGAREQLARRMAERVVAAAAAHSVVVVSSAPEVREWALANGCECLDDPGSLDLAAHTGREWVRACGLDRVVIAHADLPFVTTFDPVVADSPVAVLVPDQRDDGTPVLSLPVDAPFQFAYGPGSFVRHVAEAERIGLEVHVMRDGALGFDVDLPEDLDRLGSMRP